MERNVSNRDVSLAPLTGELAVGDCVRRDGRSGAEGSVHRTDRVAVVMATSVSEHDPAVNGRASPAVTQALLILTSRARTTMSRVAEDLPSLPRPPLTCDGARVPRAVATGAVPPCLEPFFRVGFCGVPRRHVTYFPREKLRDSAQRHALRCAGGAKQYVHPQVRPCPAVYVFPGDGGN